MDGTETGWGRPAEPAPRWRALLDRAYARCGVIPTLLERDFNIPPLPELLAEMGRIRRHQEACQALQAGVRHAG